MTRRRGAGALATAVLLALIAAISGSAAHARHAAAAGGTDVLTIGAPASGRRIPPSFLGLSMEYLALSDYLGDDPAHLDPVLLALVRNLAPGQRPVLRIGGDSTDWAWWPVRGLKQPAGVRLTLTPSTLRVLRGLAGALGARLILGVDLEADSARLAAAEARALVSGVGSDHVEALELGNEPELYGSFDWGRSGALGRPTGWDFAAFDRDFGRVSRGLPALALAGPAIGGGRWFGSLGRFLTDQPRVELATFHRYPLEVCGSSPAKPNYPSIAHLLSDQASRGLAASVAPSVGAAHHRGRMLWIDEMSTDSCGTDRDVTRSFAAALWVLDALFEMVRTGVDGVSIHTYPSAIYNLFTVTRPGGAWRVAVAPEYYGLLAFAQAAPSGSRLVTVRQSSADGLEAWATRALDGSTQLVLINRGAGARMVSLSATGRGTLALLRAPGIAASSGIQLGGQSVSPRTGRLTGSARTTQLRSARGRYAIRIPAYSAGLVALGAG